MLVVSRAKTIAYNNYYDNYEYSDHASHVRLTNVLLPGNTQTDFETCDCLQGEQSRKIADDDGAIIRVLSAMPFSQVFMIPYCPFVTPSA